MEGNNKQDQDIFPSDLMSQNPMGPSDIQSFLQKLQDDIDAGKSLLSQSVASSIEFSNTMQKMGKKAID